jgi:PKHD-type hydroxylase
MSNYSFAPSPTFGRTNQPYVFWQDGFTDEAIARIIDIGDACVKERAKVGVANGTEVADIRRTDISWIEMNQDTEWIYDKLAYIARQLNGEYYNFDLHGFWEHLQYTVYEGDEKGHYDWHIDAGPNDECPRKLSIVLQLSDPSEYEGGELQIMTNKDAITIEKKKGFLVAFPSYQLHRVTPVTSGVRRTLVVWATGPAFR